MDEEEAIANAEAYAARYQLQLLERVGSGIHGIVFFVAGNEELGVAAIKAHFSDEPYQRERDVYQRLSRLGVTQIGGFEVPSLLDTDDTLRIQPHKCSFLRGADLFMTNNVNRPVGHLPSNGQISLELFPPTLAKTLKQCPVAGVKLRKRVKQP